MRYIFFLVLTFIFYSKSKAQFYNGSQVSFGKNRVQYTTFLWQYYRFDKFEIFFYEGEKDLAVYVAKKANNYIPEIENTLEYEFDKKIQIILYKKLSEFQQSNIGYTEDEKYNIGGVTKVIGTKLFLYYEGDITKLDEQLKEGITRVIFTQMIFGSSWKEQIKNAAMLSIPAWYINGLIKYIAVGWNNEIENYVKDGVLTRSYKHFNRLKEKQSTMLGVAIWNYIAESYGKTIIPNILYMAKVSRNIESGFLFVLGLSLNNLFEEAISYYKTKFVTKDVSYTAPGNILKIKSKKNSDYYNLKISPDGKYISYVSNKMGKSKLWIFSIESNKKKKIFKNGYKIQRINDKNYPLVAWHPSGKLLAIINEKKGAIYLLLYDIEKDKIVVKKQIFDIDEILDCNYSYDGKKLIFSAVKDGKNDIYLYSISSNTQEKITNNYFDEHNPSFIKGNNYIFSSNMTNYTLTKSQEIPLNLNKNNDIIILNNNDKSIKKLTNTKEINETIPILFDSLEYAYLSDKNIMTNLFKAHFDSTISSIDTIIHYRYFPVEKEVTNFSRSILEWDTHKDINKFAALIFYNNKYNFVLYDKNYNVNSFQSKKDNYNDNINKISVNNKVKTIPFKSYIVDSLSFLNEYNQKKEIDVHNYVFNIEIDDKQMQQRSIEINTSLKDSSSEKTNKLKFPTQRVYKPAFSKDESFVQLNNSFVNGNYQPFTGGPYINPGLGTTIRLGVVDLFEDYKIYGGLRIGAGINNRDYFFGVEDLSKRLDKLYLFTREERHLSTDFLVYVIRSNVLKYSIKWPFNELSSFRAVLAYRNDQLVIKATDMLTLSVDNYDENWGKIKLAYVFDNTINKGLNLYQGLKLKLFEEYYRQIGQENNDINILGADIRYSQNIFRNIMWVNRLAGSTSFGKQKIIYYLGGVDDWMLLGDKSKFNTKTPIDFKQNYRFQALATNMRGFKQNIRNGNNFIVFNSELRIPVFKIIIQKPIKSEFIKYFQIASFGDIGTAWTGKSPYSDENLLNTEIIKKGSVTIKLFNRREPIVAGYGFGLRSKFLGYFVRLDWAWGVENFDISKKPLFYLSLSKDI